MSHNPYTEMMNQLKVAEVKVKHFGELKSISDNLISQIITDAQGAGQDTGDLEAIRAKFNRFEKQYKEGIIDKFEFLQKVDDLETAYKNKKNADTDNQ